MSVGQWLARDPIGENGGINLYAYVGNNPVNAFDPFGLWQTGAPYPQNADYSTIVADGNGGIRIQIGPDPYLLIPILRQSALVHEGVHRLDALNENNRIANDVADGVQILGTGAAQSALSEIDATRAQLAYIRR